MANRRNEYVWIYFFSILLVLSYIVYFLGEKFLLWTSYIGISIGVVLFFAVLIPLSRYLAYRLNTFIIDRNIEQNRMFRFFLLFIIILPFALMSLTVYNEYREKNLTRVLSFEPAEVQLLKFDLGSKPEMWNSENGEASKELYHFLSQYDVKRMRDDWDSDVSEEKGFLFIVHTKDDIIIATVYENRLKVVGEGGYFVTNGPIDMEWAAKFSEKYD